LADGKLDGEIPGIGRGDEIGAMAATSRSSRTTRYASAGSNRRRPRRRRVPLPSAAPRWRISPSDFERSVTGIVRSVSTAAAACRPPRNR
jgi:methyl-accepting chemotaxis protein